LLPFAPQLTRAGFADAWVYALAVTDAAVYVGGGFTQVGGEPRVAIAAVDPETGAVLPWQATVQNTLCATCTPSIHALALDGDLLYIAGAFDQIAELSVRGLSALDRVTGAPRRWSPSTGRDYHALAMTSDAVYAGGYDGLRAYSKLR
jgi:hypothetical protein